MNIRAVHILEVSSAPEWIGFLAQVIATKTLLCPSEKKKKNYIEITIHSALLGDPVPVTQLLRRSKEGKQITFRRIFQLVN